ncbi:MAG: hypothetical protein PHX08_13710 [Lachnospiraceae bacterium]|nr:hypothetical protein [Lachnospiraceae bacterium]
MDSIVNKLSEIEKAAVSIVSHAEEQKKLLEEEMEAKRTKFDDELAAETQRKIATIHAALEQKMKQELEAQEAQSIANIAAYEKEYELHHEVYAQEIIKHITEV